MIENFLNDDRKTILRSDRKIWMTQFCNQKLMTKCFGQHPKEFKQ
jgi:hypothetical protein